MIENIDLYLGIIATALVVGVPFFYGMQKKVQAAVNKAQKAHESNMQQLMAGYNAAIAYIKAHPTQDQEVIDLIKTVAGILGVQIPNIQVPVK